MAFNTGNPLGSTDFRDLKDNAENMDLALNSSELTFTDRLGVERDTWAGLQAVTGWTRQPLTGQIDTVREALDAQPVNIWEFANLVVSKPVPADPNTWDWTPAIAAAAASSARLIVFPDGIFLLTAGIVLPTDKIFQLSTGTTLRRKAGAGVFNMLSSNGTSGVEIRGGAVDGNRAADSLTPTNPAHRFSGIHLLTVAGAQVRGVRVIGTVNNETNGGIYLDACSDSWVVENVATDNDRTGIVIFNCTRCGMLNNKGFSNLGSGITSSDNVDCLYQGNETFNNGSAGNYTGLNASGLRSRVANNLSYSNTGSGINVGEVSHTADNARIIGNICYSNTLDGISVQNSSGVLVHGNTASSNARAGVRLFTNAASCEVTANIADANGAPGVHAVTGTHHLILANKCRDNFSAGVYLEAVANFAKLASNDCQGNGTGAGANAAGIIVLSADVDLVGNTSRDAGTAVQLYGVWLSGALRTNLVGNYLAGNVTAAIRETSSPTFTTRANRFGADNAAGQFTATAASTATVVANNNARAVNRIKVYPLNAAAAARPGFVSSLSVGVSFTVTFSGNSAGTEIYGYEID